MKRTLPLMLAALLLLGLTACAGTGGRADAGVLVYAKQGEVSPHLAAYPQNAVPGGVDAHVPDKDLGPGDEQPGSQEKGSGRDVPRHQDLLPV